MKKIISIINQEGNVLFFGKLLSMPMKKSAIIEKSIELFDDDDPCIIHQSYVIKKFADILEAIIQRESTHPFPLSPYKEQLYFIDLESIEECHLALGGA